MAKGTGTGRITQPSIERVLDRSDLVELASAYTQLVRRGAEHSGRCPFHDEKTPSFWVNGTKGVYHCFGCGASGDVITFLQAKQGLDFVEAVEFLADRFRVELEYDEGGDGRGKERRASKRRLYDLNEAAAAFYQAMLERSGEAEPVRDYLAARHITPETREAFRLGYSPEGGAVLAGKARQKGFTAEDLGEARLITSNGRDFFRGRLMVPIVDKASRVVGFGARKLREEQYGGKYVNSADGPLFHKKQTIFLAPGIANAAREAGSVVVVEGYMDVIAMWQAGFHNVCAVMGTALTEEQVLELKRLAPRALFAFDPDAAGQVATLRALEQARGHELDVRVVLLPEGQDPADVLHQAAGRERMEELLTAGVSLLHYRTSTLLGSGDLTDAGERERIWREAIELFRSVPDGPERRDQIGRLGVALQADREMLQALYDTTGTSPHMRLARADSREPRFREEQAVRERVATTGTHTTAVMREKRLLATAMRMAETGRAADLADQLPPEAVFAIGVHRRARAALAEGGAAALAPARVRDDEALFALVTELATLADRDRLDIGDPDALLATMLEHGRAVELQYLDRRTGELSARVGSGADADDAILAEIRTIRARQQELAASSRG